jgi:hypothetical protein
VLEKFGRIIGISYKLSKGVPALSSLFRRRSYFPRLVLLTEISLPMSKYHDSDSAPTDLSHLTHP